MLSEHAICCSMCPPLEVKESPKEKGDVILEKKKKKRLHLNANCIRGGQKPLLILHLTPGRLVYTV